MKLSPQLPPDGTLRVSSVAKSKNRGFALVVTLSLMILLTLLAVGLLSLSSISLRSSSQGAAMAEARANARLALMIAIGELQKSAGPDQRITARGDINSASAGNPRLTGVWESRALTASQEPDAKYYDFAEKGKTQFRGWLTSSPSPKDLQNIGFVDNAPPTDPKKVGILWGKNSLGPALTSADQVSALKVPTPDNRGAYAWAVLDDGMKARINTTFKAPEDTTSAKAAQLATGQAPNTEFLPGLGDLKRDFFKDVQGSTSAAIISKGITGQNFSLSVASLTNSAVAQALKPLTHDVTTSSVGLFTNVATGGIKEDFNLVTNGRELPQKYKGKGVYESLLGMSGSELNSDPSWSSLFDVANLYKSKVTTANGVPQIALQAPPGWNAAAPTAGSTAQNLKPPGGALILPSILKVQMVMSMIARDIYGGLPPAPLDRKLSPTEKRTGIHEPQDGFFRATDYDYDLHLLYTPVVTLHNPYNVALEFTNLKLEFKSIPFALRITRSGQPQSKDFVPLDQMTEENQAGNKVKPFVLKLKTKKAGIPDSPTFKMLPGEIIMFSPYIDPKLTWRSRGTFSDVDLKSSKTRDMDAMPGWPGNGIGFDCDWLSGDQRLDTGHTFTNGRWGGAIALKWNDELFVEFAPIAAKSSENKFVVNMSADAGGANRIISSLELNYGSKEGLLEHFKKSGQEMPMRYPKTGFFTTADIVDRAESSIASLARVKPFAVLSFQAKTTAGGKTAGTLDGSFAAKPWSFAHANIGASAQKIGENQASASHDFDLKRLDGFYSDTISLNAKGRGLGISGYTRDFGVPFGVQYEIPLGPLKALAMLNSANPGGSSGSLPRFAHPIGNSWAHPMLSGAKMVESNLIDHSSLLNTALYDRFYFSGFALKAGTTTDASDLAGLFAKGESVLGDQRLILNNPDGKNANELKGIVETPTAFEKVAAWQMMKGAFNVNSTSVSAWKAMLASIQDEKAIVNSLRDESGDTTALGPLSKSKSKEVRISRLSLPGSESVGGGADLKRAYWLGPREYSDTDLSNLAQKIVDQVRKRGPFLSMAEFVNRQLGSSSGNEFQMGALQGAIDATGLNDDMARKAEAGYTISKDQVRDYQYRNADAGTGPSYQGAPGYLTQADLLNVLGNAATVRSDTFTIRTQGEARSATGQVTATAYCEAVVQRTLQWVDPKDPVDTAQANLTSAENKTFGRRFALVSFRWLNVNEI